MASSPPTSPHQRRSSSNGQVQESKGMGEPLLSDAPADCPINKGEFASINGGVRRTKSSPGIGTRVVTFSDSVILGQGDTKGFPGQKRGDGEHEDCAKPHGEGYKTDLREELKKYEALDYTLSESELQRAKLFDRSRLELEEEGSRIHRLRWMLTFVVALFTALVAILITWFTQQLLKFRLNLAQNWIDKEQNGDAFPGCALLITVGLCGGMAALGGLFVVLEPVAAGSGIPEIKSLLNGVMIKRSMRIKTLFAKAGGVALAVGAGLPVGKEGPMIHTGAICGAGLSQGKSSTFGFDTRWSKFKEFRNDKEKRDFIACGSAAGVAAAFGAPLAGVMFCLEEGASWWHPDLTWRTLFCAMTSAFVTNVFLSGIRGESNSWGMLSRSGLLSFGEDDGSNDDPWKYTAWEIPGFVMIGAVGGFLGAGFNHLNMKLTIWRQHNISGRFKRYVEVVALAMVITLFALGLPMATKSIYCRDVEPRESCPSRTSIEGYTTRLYCPEGQFHVLGTIFFNSPENAIRFLFYEPSDDDIQSECNLPSGALAMFMAPYLLFACLTYGVAMPSGMFIPLIMSGAVMGRLFGYVIGGLLQELGIEVAQHGAYALIGSAAMLGGVTRMTISLTLIIIETTGVVQFGLPVFLTALAARVCGHLINEGLYDIHMELRHVPFLTWDPPIWYQTIRASEIMSYSPVCLDMRSEAGKTLEILKKERHNGFPVVETTVTSGITRRKLRGIILRKHLCQLLSPKFRHRVLHSPRTGQSQGTELQWDELESTYPHFPPADKLELKEAEKKLQLDLSTYMNPVPHVVPPNASVWHVYQIFRQMGLRHLCVIDNAGDVIGMITRQDLTTEHCKQCFDFGSRTPSIRTWRPLPAHQRPHGWSAAGIEDIEALPNWTMPSRRSIWTSASPRNGSDGSR